MDINKTSGDNFFEKSETPDQRTITITPSIVLSTKEPISTTVVSPTINPTITVAKPAFTAVPTFLPSLNPTEQAAMLKEMIETNGGCKLPCWWGFQPGVTSYKGVKPILKSLSNKVEEYQAGQFTFVGAISATRTKIGSIQLVQDYVVDQNNIIQYIKISAGQLYQVFPLQELLKRNGKPDDIWIMTYSTQYHDQPVRFELYLLYLNQRFLARYQFMDVKINQQYVIGCGRDTPLTNLWLWKPENFKSLNDINEFFGANLELYAFQKIQDVSNLDVDKFTRQFTVAGSDDCIVTPKKYWRPNDGS